jgi:hypothetical protein
VTAGTTTENLDVGRVARRCAGSSSASRIVHFFTREEAARG